MKLMIADLEVNVVYSYTRSMPATYASPAEGATVEITAIWLGEGDHRMNIAKALPEDILEGLEEDIIDGHEASYCDDDAYDDAMEARMEEMRED